MVTLKKTLSPISKIKTSNILLGVAMAVYKTPLFFTKTFVILNIQPTMVFSLMTILCESWATPQMMAKSNEGLIMTKVPHNDSKANQRAIPKNES
jgi:hypothetical protein